MMKRTAIVQNAGTLVSLAANTLQEHFKKQGDGSVPIDGWEGHRRDC